MGVGVRELGNRIGRDHKQILKTFQSSNPRPESVEVLANGLGITDRIVNKHLQGFTVPERFARLSFLRVLHSHRISKKVQNDQLSEVIDLLKT